MKKVLIHTLNSLLGLFGKRVTNIHSPAKPYREGVLFLKSFIERPACIIDIGVADGTPDLTNAFPYGEYPYLLIEASPTFSEDMDRIQASHPDIFVEKCFCGEKEETVQFHINKGGHTASRYRSASRKETIEVMTRKLDTIVEEKGLTGPFFLKIDVEGAECDVLKGGVETLKSCDVVILESWINVTDDESGGSFASLIALMDQHGFVVFDFFGGHTHKSGVLAHIDIVFVKHDSPYRNYITKQSA